MTDYNHTEQMSRQQVAERLTDLAYALAVGSPVTLRVDGEQVRAPDAEELLLRWRTRCTDGQVELALEVSWSANGAAASSASA